MNQANEEQEKDVDLTYGRLRDNGNGLSPHAYLSAASLAGLPGLEHAFYTRACGYVHLSDLLAEKEGALVTHRRMAEHLGVSPQRFLFCRQVHSSDVVAVDKPWEIKEAPEADAMVTTVPGLALGIMTADCVPVLFAATNVPVIAAAHAGWRGALGGVLERTLEAMEKCGAKREAICAALGPCIWKDSYEVGADFQAAFLEEDARNTQFFEMKERYYFDLPGYVTAKLKRLGINQAAPSPADTYAEPDRFFSYRYETRRGLTREGRLVSAIALAKSAS